MTSRERALAALPDIPLDERPEIAIGSSIAELTDAAEAALAERPELGLYSRGNVLVRVVRDGAAGLEFLTRPPGAPTIAQAGQAWLREQLDRAAIWTAKGKPKMPPVVVVQTLADRSEWGALRPLEAVVECPVFIASGEVLDTPGYHAKSGILYDPGQTVFPAVPRHPGEDHAREAVEQLSEPLRDFPFVADADRAVVLAAILTLIARPAFQGPAPAFAFRSSTPGSGKSLLADAVAVIATGRDAARMSAPKDDDETRKRIMALALAGAPLVLVDNCTGAVGSKSLAAALTAHTWADRILGLTETRTVPLRAVWIFTGNNLTFTGDLGRRVVPCDIEPACEFPEDRTGFRYAPLLGHLGRVRGSLVAAALTILRAYHEAGRPNHGRPPKGSYEPWDGLIRGALIWSGAGDPLETVERIRDEGDVDREALTAGLRTLHGMFVEDSFRAADAATRAADDPEAREALAAFCCCDERQISGRRLGYALRSAAGRPVGGLVLRRLETDSHAKVTRWSVRRCG